MLTIILSFTVLHEIIAASADLHEQWELYKTVHGKAYASHHEPGRFAMFKTKVNLIERHNERYNRGEESYRLGLNAHSDMSPEEFQDAHFGLVLNEKYRASLNLTTHVTSPASKRYIDWRAKKKVSKVKNQTACGACYAFTAAGLFESYLMLRNETEKNLSEQDIIDCSYMKSFNKNNLGCKGGDYLFTIKLFISKGIAMEKLYPYTSGQTKEVGRCKPRNETKRRQLRFEVVSVKADENEFVNALQNGPLAVVLNGENEHFYSYQKGIYNYSACGTVVNHSALLVGYGEKNGREYWVIKNSWGTSWGEKGFMRLAKGYNRCGIASHPAYYLK